MEEISCSEDQRKGQKKIKEMPDGTNLKRQLNGGADISLHVVQPVADSVICVVFCALQRMRVGYGQSRALMLIPLNEIGSAIFTE